MQCYLSWKSLFLFLGRCGPGRVEDGGWDQFRDPQPGMIFSYMHIYRELTRCPFRLFKVSA